jgi:hypothetical protein
VSVSVVDDSDPRLIWRSLGRGLDRHYPPEGDQPDSILQLLEALRRRDQAASRTSGAA